MLAVAAATAAVVTLGASPAHAAGLKSLAEPYNNNAVPGCYGAFQIQRYDLDNPRKAGYQKWGTVRVMQGTCYSTVNGEAWQGVWTEARLDTVNDPLKTRIGVQSSSGTYYYLTDWDARGQDVWHDSPVLQRMVGARFTSSVETAADGQL